MSPNLNSTKRQFLRTIGTGSVISVIGTTGLGVQSVEAQEGGESWFEDGFDNTNSGHAPENTVPTGTVEEYWSYQLDVEGRIESVLGDDHFIYTITTDKIYTLTADDGTEQWTFEADDIRTAVLSNNTIFIAAGGELSSLAGGDPNPEDLESSFSTLYALSIDDGSTIWEYTPEEYRSTSEAFEEHIASRMIESSPSVTNGSIYIPTSSGSDPSDQDDGRNGALHKLETDSGVEQWTSEFDNLLTKPAVTGDTIYIGCRDTYLYALDASDGTESWRFEVTHPIESPPVYSDGIVYVANGRPGRALQIENDQNRSTTPGILYAVNSTDGSELWSFEINSDRIDRFQQPIIINDSVYVVYEEWPTEDGGRINRTLYRINADDGTVTWSTELNTVWIRGANETLYARVNRDWTIIDIADGSIQKRVPFESEFDQFWIHPVVINGQFYVQTNNELSSFAGENVQAGSGALTTVFQQAQNQSDNPLLIGALGAGILGGCYATYRKLVSDTDEQKMEKSEAVVDDPETFTVDDSSTDSALAIDEYSEIDLKHTVKTLDESQVQSGIVDHHSVWVITPDRANGETVDSKQISQFTDRIQTWAQMDSSPNLLSIYGSGTDPLPWVALEKADYSALIECVDSLSTEETVAAIQQVCQALHHIHRYGISYDNLATRSVLYTDENTVKLRGVLDQFEDLNLWYNAPEEFDAESTEQSTIYRIGLIAYELFTGTLPYAEYPDGVAREAVQSDELILPSEQVDGIPPALESTIMKALSKSPDDRQETVLHLRDEFDSLDLN